MLISISCDNKIYHEINYEWLGEVHFKIFEKTIRLFCHTPSSICSTVEFMLFEAYPFGGYSWVFDKCKECVQSNCFNAYKYSRVLNPADESQYFCLTCIENIEGNKLHHFLSECTSSCSRPNKKCVCQYVCYMCIDTTLIDAPLYDCKNYSTTQVDANCIKSPYQPCW